VGGLYIVGLKLTVKISCWVGGLSYGPRVAVACTRVGGRNSKI
jgi:hypothetical protein